MSHDHFVVRHLPDEQRYALIDTAEGDREVGQEGYIDLEVDGRTHRMLVHTGVSEEYGGQGLASLLVRQVVDDIVSQGHLIVPICPYVVAWLPKHPEYAEHVVKATPAHLQAMNERRGE
ncbi:MAG: GNAT family N-acetyltransferase [Microbacteriaceae bacterium]